MVKENSVQLNSVAQFCLTLCNPMDCSTTGFSVYQQIPEFYSKSCPLSQWCHPTILCCPLLLLPSVFLLLPSVFLIIRVFSNESFLRIRWPKYWSFSSSISPSNEYSGLISFRRDWLNLLAVQGALKKIKNL